jgi:tripartite-type tricarboxylate transporter receptor subunit TctC
MSATIAMRLGVSVILIAAACCGMVGPAATEDAPRMTIVVGFSSGGTYDATARLFARHLGRHLPGNPTVTVVNMPGAGSMAATNHLFNVAPRDGSVLAVINGAMVFEPLFGNPAAKFDPRQFAWIGGRSTETALCAVWHTAAAASISDVMTHETAVGSIGPGSRTYNHSKMLNSLLGTKFRIVNGYPGGAEITLAMERGELDGYCGWAWGSIRSRSYDWVRDKKMRLLVQTGLQRIAELPDVPFGLDLAKSKDDQDVMRILVTDTQLAWPLLAPPGLPADKIAALRSGLNAAMKDPELIRDAEKMQLDVEPVSGEAMQSSIAQLFGLSPAVVDRAKAIIK